MNPPEEPVATGENWVIDEVFDRNSGWPLPADQAAITLVRNKSGYITYNVKMDDVNVQVWEIHRWKNSPNRDMPAGRIATRVQFTGIRIGDPAELLRITYKTSGFPSLGVNEKGQPSLHIAFPVTPSSPVDVVRRQIMTCVGILVVEATELLELWRKNARDKRPNQAT